MSSQRQMDRSFLKESPFSRGLLMGFGAQSYLTPRDLQVSRYPLDGLRRDREKIRSYWNASEKALGLSIKGNAVVSDKDKIDNIFDNAELDVENQYKLVAKTYDTMRHRLLSVFALAFGGFVFGVISSYLIGLFSGIQ